MNARYLLLFLHQTVEVQLFPTGPNSMSVAVLFTMPWKFAMTSLLFPLDTRVELT